QGVPRHRRGAGGGGRPRPGRRADLGAGRPPGRMGTVPGSRRRRTRGTRATPHEDGSKGHRPRARRPGHGRPGPRGFRRCAQADRAAGPKEEPVSQPDIPRTAGTVPTGDHLDDPAVASVLDTLHRAARRDWRPALGVLPYFLYSKVTGRSFMRMVTPQMLKG